MPSPAKYFLLVLLLSMVAGCSVVDGLGAKGKPKQETATPAQLYEAQLALDYLALLERLAQASPAGQAEIIQEARRAAELDPTLTNQLRRALVLALPGHAGSEPSTARTELVSLLAAPERLLPVELSLAHVMLQDVNARLALLSENQRLTEDTGRDDKERIQALNRRLQAQAADTARLQKELEDALAKLEAVADLERSMVERQVAPKGRKP